MSNMPDPTDPKLAGINIPNPTQFGAEGDNDQHAVIEQNRAVAFDGCNL